MRSSKSNVPHSQMYCLFEYVFDCRYSRKSNSVYMRHVAASNIVFRSHILPVADIEKSIDFDLRWNKSVNGSKVSFYFVQYEAVARAIRRCIDCGKIVFSYL